MVYPHDQKLLNDLFGYQRTYEKGRLTRHNEDKTDRIRLYDKI